MENKVRVSYSWGLSKQRDTTKGVADGDGDPSRVVAG